MSMERRRAGRYTDNDYFRMGAAIAVGELYDMAAFGRFLEDDREVKSYLESFGVRATPACSKETMSIWVPGASSNIRDQISGRILHFVRSDVATFIGPSPSWIRRARATASSDLRTIPKASRYNDLPASVRGALPPTINLKKKTGRGVGLSRERVCWILPGAPTK